MSSPSDPLDSAIPVGSGPGTNVPPPISPPPPTTQGQQQPPPPRRTTPSGNDKIWVLLSHLSSFIGLPFLLPLIVYLAMKDESAYVAENAKEALNFHITLLICVVVLCVLVITIPLAVAAGLAGLVFAVIAAIRSADGQIYRYPVTLRLVK